MVFRAFDTGGNTREKSRGSAWIHNWRVMEDEVSEYSDIWSSREIIREKYFEYHTETIII
jgi:hypothetical protein